MVYNGVHDTWRVFMAYFLKRVKSFIRKDGVDRGDYLQIYESFYNKEKKQTSHKMYKVIGYVNELKESGITDPISYYKKEVDKLNQEKKTLKIKKIEDNPTKNIGYFLIKSVFNTLKVDQYFNIMGKVNQSNYDFNELIQTLTCARVVNPCSKLKTFEEVIPTMYEKSSLSLDNIYDGLEVIGDEYERIIEVMNNLYDKKYRRKTSKVYFDCTNYYFEIDSSFEDKQKGPSKENRKEPIIGMGLLLDEDQIPLTMKMYPGNESEKPIIREVIQSMKNKYNITGRTIQVADKGLNCSKNIISALRNNDGYIFSQSVKMLEDKEKNWVLLDNDYKEVRDVNGNIAYKFKYCIDEFPYKYVNDSGKTCSTKLKQIRVITYNPSLAKKQILEINKLIEKAKCLSSSRAKKNEYGESGKYISFKKLDDKGELVDENIVVSLNQEKIDMDLRLAGYNMIISSELKMKPQEIYLVYHRLWRIEETFRLLKTSLEARPVYLRKKESIYGHFLICYLSIFALRILQLKKFNDEIHPNQIIEFVRNLNVIKVNNQYINISSKDKIEVINTRLGLNLDNYVLTDKNIKKIMGFTI